MKRMNKKLNANEFNALFSYFDTNHNRNIDFKEFKKGLRGNLGNTKISDKDLKTLFNYFDTNKNHNIDFSEFKKGLIGGSGGLKPYSPEDYQPMTGGSGLVPLTRGQNQEFLEGYGPDIFE